MTILACMVCFVAGFLLAWRLSRGMRDVAEARFQQAEYLDYLCQQKYSADDIARARRREKEERFIREHLSP